MKMSEMAIPTIHYMAHLIKQFQPQCLTSLVSSYRSKYKMPALTLNPISIYFLISILLQFTKLNAYWLIMRR